MKKAATPKEQTYEVRPGQSVELLKELHILTRDGRMNQDSRRKLKQIYHLMNFIEPLLKEMRQQRAELQIVDHGAGKSYLGFIIHDLYVRPHAPHSRIHGIERRGDLVERSRDLAARLGFAGMSFHGLSVAESIVSPLLPAHPDLVTALHACDTATDDAIDFALQKQAQALVVVPCCQAEIAAHLRQGKAAALARGARWRAEHLPNSGAIRCIRASLAATSPTCCAACNWKRMATRYR